MIFGRAHEVRSGQCTHDKYTQRAKKPPQAMVHITCSKLRVDHAPHLYDIVFTKVNASWVHNTHEDALVITAEIANSLVHRLVVDSGSAINILY